MKENILIDKSIDFVIADAQGKQYKVEEIRYINFDIRLINKENLSISITKNDEDFDYEFGLMITDEGTYVVRLFDEYGNSYFFTFEIDKTPPKATLYGVEEFARSQGKTAGKKLANQYNKIIEKQARKIYNTMQENKSKAKIKAFTALQKAKLKIMALTGVNIPV